MDVWNSIFQKKNVMPIAVFIVVLMLGCGIMPAIGTALIVMALKFFGF